MIDFVDHDGNTLMVGQMIVWAHLIGRSAGIQKAVIVGFTPKMVRIAYFRWNQHWLMEPGPDGWKRFVLDGNGNKIEARPPELRRIDTSVKPGDTLLIWPGEEWEELREARLRGLLDG